MMRIHQYKGESDETKTSQFCMLKSISINSYRHMWNMEANDLRTKQKDKTMRVQTVLWNIFT